VSADGNLLLSIVTGAGLLFTWTGLVAGRGRVRGGARLAGGLTLLAGAQAALLAHAEISDLVGGPGSAQVAGHVLKVMAFGVIGWWLWGAVRSSLRLRFVAAFSALLVVVILVLSSALTAVVADNVEDHELQRVAGQLKQGAAALGRDQSRALLDDASVISGLSSLQERLARRQALRQAAAELVGGGVFRIDFAVFLGPGRRVLAYSGRGPYRFLQNGRVARRPLPLEDADILRVAASPVVTDVARLGSTFAAGLDRIGPRSLAVLAAHRVPHPFSPGKAAGFVVIGRFLDANTLAGLAHRSAPSQASLVANGKVLYSTLPGPVRASELIAGNALARLADGQRVVRMQRIGSRRYFSALARLTGAGGVPVATLVLSSPARVLKQSQAGVTRALFLVALGAGVVALALALVSGGRIARPIQELTLAARRIQEGDLEASAPAGAPDEVGALGESFNEMTRALWRMTGELRAAAREEQELRARIEAIVLSMADGLIAVDAATGVLTFNPEAERLTGRSSEDVLGRPLETWLRIEDAAGRRVRLPIFTLTEGLVSDVFLVASGGRRIPVAVTCTVLRSEAGKVTGGVAVIRDMTREHEIESMKSEFLANISHELRTPLTPIKGYAEILRRRDVPDDKRVRFATGIFDASKRLERIIELLVDFAAMEAGRLAPKRSALDVAATISAVGAALSERYPGRFVVTDLAEDVPPVDGDERLIRRVLEEMVDNAMKFSPEGGEVRITARTVTVAEAEGAYVGVTVEDEGIGIPAPDLQKAFSEFRQIDGSKTRAYGGLGLGLSFARRIVEAHGGRLSIESEEGRGTRVTMTFPAAGQKPLPAGAGWDESEPVVAGREDGAE
jgi:PAS domain S-box-containing protein